MGGRALAAATILIVAAVCPVPASVAQEPSPTFEAVTVWQHRLPGGDWDVWYAILGRPSSDAPPSQLGWWTPSGPPGDALASLGGDDENPHVTVVPGTTRAVAVWDNGGDIRWAELGPSGPAPAQTLVYGSASDRNVDPAVAFDTDGTGLAVWVNRSGDGDVLQAAGYDGSAWSSEMVVPGSGGAASLPELTFLDADGGTRTPHAALVAYADLHDGRQRTHTARWDGDTWEPATPVPLDADQEALVEDHGSADYDRPQGAFARLDVGAEVGGGAQVLWAGPAGEDLAERFISPSVQGARLHPDGTWSAIRSPSGNPGISGTCHSPAVAMTGYDDLVGVFGSTSLLEHTRIVGGEVTDLQFTYNSDHDDARPSVAPLRDRVVTVASGLSFPWNPSSGDVIVWSIGTLRPAYADKGASVTWSDPLAIDVAGEARYPEVASALGGTNNPLSVRKGGHAYASSVSDTTVADTGRVMGADGSDRADEATFGAGDLSLTGAAGRVVRVGDGAVATATIGEVHLDVVPRIVLRGVRATASNSCSEGGATDATAFTVQVGDEPPVRVEPRRNMSLTFGTVSLRLYEQRITPLHVSVRAVRVLLPDSEIVLGYAHAELDGCPGSGPPILGQDPHEH